LQIYRVFTFGLVVGFLHPDSSIIRMMNYG